ncbi:M48 family metallopeptidase [Limnofasciculus baicalensis]|uniref:M48 family metallopeptidase n=1 Tax=Limnofasciculus baicalensis BBK-W-15 TaxID=2699891 RepID=A0AAE3H0R6_9CYAN|nr:M48 family metallopeptidase [Limnofasciculus baicalensis]MCP2732157.1 M48 family metallopeptidase [Limnofasciculus baicalensis BBK-W-15]
MFNPLTFLSRHSRRRIFYPLVSFVLTLSLVISIPQVTQARSLFDIIFQGIQIIQLSNISDRQEVAIGKQINEQLVNNQFQIYDNSQINRYVNDIGQRLVKQSKRPNISYTFQVVDDQAINAAATMGGFIYVNRGLIAAADNEAQLASVIAHEIGHIAARHAIQQMRQTAIARGLAVAAGVDRNTLVNIGVELAFKLPNSRKDELEADKLGLETLQKSGYAQSAMVEFMKKLLNSGGSSPTILSSHPATSDRITALNQSIDPARANIGDGLNNSAYKTKIRPLL